jgi:aspartyl-tRNA(Asn)/glutamyl-tRNA(Gln) amidotransferase subunit C
MSTLSRDEVAHVAMLARIRLTDDELDRLAGQLDQIVEWVGQVNEVAAADVPPMSHPMPLVNVTRPDEVRPGLTAEQALANAPAAQDGRFGVPRILDED